MRKAQVTLFAAMAPIAWLAAIAAGLVMLWSFSTRPGDAAVAPIDWPAGSTVARSSRLPTLVMLVHPKCPCSRATLSELDRLMADCSGRLDAHVLFIRPAGADPQWASTDLWTTASRIRGVTVHRDDGGVEAERFGSFTSGQALLYDRDGRLLFRGGITRSRGEEGDNAGRAAIAALVGAAPPEAKADANGAAGVADVAQAPVYGCPLFAYRSNSGKSRD